MTNTELLAKLSDALTPELRSHFDKMVKVDIVDNRPYIDNYENAIAFYIKDEYLAEREYIISYLQKQELIAASIVEGDIHEEELKSFIMVAIRCHLLKEHGTFLSYEEKLSFILKSNRIFNFFRKYELPDFGEFTGFPCNDDEKLIFIDFIIKNYFDIERNLDYLKTRISALRTFESLKAEFLYKANEINYKSKITEEIYKFDELIKSDYLKDYWLFSYTFHGYIEEFRLSFKDILLSTNDPLIYYIVLFFHEHVIHYAKYSNFLKHFDWNAYDHESTFYKIDQFNFHNYNGATVSISQFDNDGRIVIYGTGEYIHAVKKLIGNEILKPDLNIIIDAFGRTGDLILNTIQRNRTEPYVLKGLKKNAKSYIAIYESIKSNYIKRIFFPTFIEYLSQREYSSLNPSRISYIKSLFDAYTNEFEQQTETEIMKVKLKTHLTVKELAQLFNILNTVKPAIFDVSSEAELHRFINANFQTKQSENISVNSLKNLFHDPDHKAIVSIEDIIHKMLNINKDMKKK